jgi:glutathione synthase/RimK-type ligase-like ATP-grasp enzyme
MSVLLLTNRRDFTADFVVIELQKRDVDYIRLNTEDIPTKVDILWTLEKGFLVTENSSCDLDKITSIWYRRPVPPLPSDQISDPLSREFVIKEAYAAFYGILRSLNCFWVSHPDSLHAASFKTYQLRKAVDIGFQIPNSIVTNVPNRAQDFINRQKAGSIYKPLSMARFEGLGGKQQLIFTSQIEAKHLEELERVKYTPCLFQNLVPKDVDIRATVIEDKVFAVAIDSQIDEDALIDWRRGNSIELPHTVVELPKDIEYKCLRLVDELGLSFGAIDLIRDPQGRHWFLEINGSGQWAWIEQLTGLNLTGALVDLLTRRE